MMSQNVDSIVFHNNIYSDIKATPLHLNLLILCYEDITALLLISYFWGVALFSYISFKAISTADSHIS